jgi:glycosyltransferase involved in cell wall biosynthesis
MTGDNTVSVIIPAFNVESSLVQCIESALDQTHRPLEIIVIDDGSTDDTGRIARDFGDTIVYLKQSNHGQGAARNMGLQNAHGEFIAFLDADDYWRQEFLQRCIWFLNTYPEAVAVSTGMIVRMVDGAEQIGPRCLRSHDGITEPTVLDNFFEFWADQDHVRTGTVLIRRNIVESAGYQRADLRVSQDLEYWAYIATFGKWGFIPEPLWVGNSRAAAVEEGWFEKYRTRRSLCPTVESWEQRIRPRLNKSQINNFDTVRGRVAANFAQNKILSRSFSEALEIVKKYGSSMPHNRLTALLRTGVKLGAPGWWIVCRIVRAKEFLKVLRLRWISRFVG